MFRDTWREMKRGHLKSLNLVGEMKLNVQTRVESRGSERRETDSCSFGQRCQGLLSSSVLWMAFHYRIHSQKLGQIILTVGSIVQARQLIRVDVSSKSEIEVRKPNWSPIIDRPLIDDRRGLVMKSG